MNLYQQQVLDNYHNPRNYGKPQSYNHEAEATNLSCGDEIHVFVEDRKSDDLNNSEQVVDQIHFEGEGCAICIATASLLTEALEGKTHDEIDRFSEKELLDLIGIELTTSRKRCATLSLEAIKKALQN